MENYNIISAKIEAGRVLNVDRKAITNNCVGKSKSSGGFIWSKIKKENIYE